MAASGSYVAYELYKESARTLRWGNSGTGTGSNQSIPVYGRVPGGQTTPPPANYVDTILVTVAY